MQAMRQAFQQALKDPPLLSEAERSKLDVRLFSGAEMEAAIAQLFKMPASIKTMLEPLRQN